MTAYTVDTPNGSNKVTATADADVTVTLNGSEVTNGTALTWVAGDNELKVVVADGKTYTVTVHKVNA